MRRGACGSDRPSRCSSCSFGNRLVFLPRPGALFPSPARGRRARTSSMLCVTSRIVKSRSRLISCTCPGPHGDRPGRALPSVRPISARPFHRQHTCDGRAASLRQSEGGPVTERSPSKLTRLSACRARAPYSPAKTQVFRTEADIPEHRFFEEWYSGYWKTRPIRRRSARGVAFSRYRRPITALRLGAADHGAG